MPYLSADCIIPIEGEPCFNSVLVVDNDGSIEGIIAKNDLKGSLNEIIHYNGILCPGFVNTHCHLELSWAEGLFSEGEGLDHFIWQLGKFRKSVSKTHIRQAIEKAAATMIKSGIVATADISNENHTLDFKSKNKHYFHTFVEVFGSDPAKAEAIIEKAVQLKAQFENKSLAVSIVPHATYSLSEELFRLITKTGKEKIHSLHHQENEDENHFFRDGSGLVSDRRKAFNPDLPAFPGTGKRPMESISTYLDQEEKLLLVHNTATEQQDIDFVKRYFSQPYWCLCPNANLYIENKLPNVQIFRSSGCKITIGTDSLASNHQLSILEEIKTIQLHFPQIPLNELLEWSTLNGAELLGMEQKLGSFVKGKCPGVVLIENADMPALKLRPETTSRLIIPANL